MHESFLSLEAREPVGDLLETFKVRSGGDGCAAPVRLRVEVEAFHHCYAERPRNNGMARLV
jgi:hypothetical protein